jgi:anaerobic magnesium-protoporphyrin IX monomethyl ester cyclase
MNVLFIYPNIGAQIGFNYGVAFLSAALKHNGHSTALINVNDKLGYPLDIDRIKNDAAAFQPDLIGFSLVTNQYSHGREIAGELKKHFPDVPIIAGGVHVTMAPREVLDDCPAIDYACVGEGEDALAELVDALEKGGPTDNIANIWTRRDGRIVSNPVRPFPEIAGLPPKDYDIFDFQRMIDAKNGWVGLMASRGCPFRCSYCFNHKIVKLYEAETGLSGRDLGYIRRHPVDDIISEIDYLLTNYDRITTFIFDDDLFTHNRDYVLEFCQKYKEKFDVPFIVNGHVRVFDDEIADALKQGGCWMVKFGLESGSRRIREEVMHRRMSNGQMSDAFAAAHRAGLETSAFVMFGLPHETRDEIMETIQLLADIKPTRYRWAIFFPFIGTDAYQIARDAGIVDLDRMQQLSNFMDASCLDFGPELNLFIKKLQKTYPWWVNAATDWPCAEQYREKVAQIDAMDETEFDAVSASCRDDDERMSLELCNDGLIHFAIKYNAFMAVQQP